MKDLIKIIFIITGTVIGAGFITGNELMYFFARFLPYGYISLFLSCIIFAICFMGVGFIIINYNIKNYSEFSKLVFGRFNHFFEIVVILFMFFLFSAMISANGEIISDIFDIDTIFSKLISAFIIYILLFFDKKAVVYVNNILMPVIILGCFYIYIKCYSKNPIISEFSYDFMILPFVYSSYNIITSICVICDTNIIKDKKTAVLSSVFSALILFLIAYFIISVFDLSVIKVSFPVFEIVKRYGGFLPYIYAFTLISAIITTALSNCYCVIEYTKNRLLICVLGFLFSIMDFSYFVSKIYVLFGYVGFFEIIIIVFYILLKMSVYLRAKK